MFWLIPLALKAIAITAGSIVAIGAFAVLVDEIISRITVRNVMNDKGINNVLIRVADRTSNVVSFRDLDTFEDWEIHGSGIADDVRVGDKITLY